jgi:GNAT superfamily N-acetyltransferase
MNSAAIQVQVRPGRFEDIAFEADLNRSLDWCYDERTLLVEFHDHAYEPSSVLVAEVDGKVVGKMELFLARKTTHGRFGMIRRFAVVEPCRGGGIGKAMLDAAAERARDAGCTFLELSVDVTNPEAQTFYRREGFVADRVEVMMRRSLDGLDHSSNYAAQADPASFAD